MSSKLNSLNDDDVRQIALLVETLDRSTFDYLQLDIGQLKLTIGKGDARPTLHEQAISPGASAVPILSSQTAAAPAPTSETAEPMLVVQEPRRTGKAENRGTDGTVAIVAPIMGRFYAKPDPGAPPFVSVGATVGPNDTVALIEVMKVFSAIQSNVTGVVTEICAQDAEVVEFGQVLFRIRPK